MNKLIYKVGRVSNAVSHVQTQKKKRLTSLPAGFCNWNTVKFRCSKVNLLDFEMWREGHAIIQYACNNVADLDCEYSLMVVYANGCIFVSSVFRGGVHSAMVPLFRLCLFVKKDQILLSD